MVALLAAAPSGADERCDQWLAVSPLKKREVILKSFEQPKSAGHDVDRDRCLNEAASAMLSEIDGACRSGAALDAIWASTGVAWTVTCSVVLARAKQDDPVSLKEREEIRSAWDACVEENRDPDSCRKQVLKRFAVGRASGESSECQAFAKLPAAARLNEVYDRIRMRFSLTEEVASCLRGQANEIEAEVKVGCRESGSDAFAVWEQVLGEHTDRCLGRDTVF